MKMDAHPVAPEEIMALLDAELPPERAQLVSGHLAECSACGGFANTLASASRSLASWAVPAGPTHTARDSNLFATARRVAGGAEPWTTGRAASFFRRHWLVSALAGTLAVAWLGTQPFAVDHFAAPGQWGDLVDQGRFERRTKTVRAMREGSPKALPLATPPAKSTGIAGGVGGRVGSLPADRNGLVGGNGNAVDTYPVDKAQVDDTESKQREDTLGSAHAAFEPMIARTVSLSLVAKDFSSSRAALEAVLARHHGYAASLAADTRQNTARSLQASLRIPAGELHAALAELKALGQVQSESQNGEEVTPQHADLVARLKNSRETERRLQAILEQRTGKVSDVLAVEQEIARVRGEIEQMEAEQKSLEHRVRFATVDLTIAEEYKAQIHPPSPAISTRVHNALVRGYNDAVENVVRIALFFASYGPSLLVWLAFLAPIVWLARRRWQRVAAASAMRV